MVSTFSDKSMREFLGRGALGANSKFWGMPLPSPPLAVWLVGTKYRNKCKFTLRMLCFQRKCSISICRWCMRMGGRQHVPVLVSSRNSYLPLNEETYCREMNEIFVHVSSLMGNTMRRSGFFLNLYSIKYSKFTRVNNAQPRMSIAYSGSTPWQKKMWAYTP